MEPILPGQEIDLCRALRSRIAEVVSDLRLPTDSNDDALRAPQVVNGYLPPKRQNDEPDYPFVIVRPGKGSTTRRDMSAAEVKLLIGCYSEEFDGFEECLMVMSHLRTSFMERPILEKRWQFELPFEWTNFDDQPWPQWNIECTCRWSLYTPQDTQDLENI